VGVRQALTAGVAQTLVAQHEQDARGRTHLPCETCPRPRQARPAVPRTVETLVGALARARPSCSGRPCHRGRDPLDDVREVHAGRLQREVQHAALDRAPEGPSATASSVLGRLRGIAVRRKRRHTCTTPGAAGLSVLAGAPPRAEMEHRVARGAAGRLRRPVLGLGMDGASVPSRPDRARGRRPGQARARARRARWRHAGDEAQGVRCSLRDGDRLVPLRSWHQGHRDDDLGQAWQKRKDAGWMPEDTGRLWVLGDGAHWLGQHGQALCPDAGQGLDSSHGAASLQKGADAHSGHP